MWSSIYIVLLTDPNLPQTRDEAPVIGSDPWNWTFSFRFIFMSTLEHVLCCQLVHRRDTSGKRTSREELRHVSWICRWDLSCPNISRHWVATHGGTSRIFRDAARCQPTSLSRWWRIVRVYRPGVGPPQMLTDIEHCNVAWRDLRGVWGKATKIFFWTSVKSHVGWKPSKPRMTRVFAFCLFLQWMTGGQLVTWSEAHSGIFNDQDIQRHDSACPGNHCSQHPIIEVEMNSDI